VVLLELYLLQIHPLNPEVFLMDIIIGLKKKGQKDWGYIILEKNNGKLTGKGPIGKFFSEKAISELVKICKLKEKDSVFFSADKIKVTERISGIARQKLGEELNLINNKKFEFCWITDYPMYQYDDKEKKIDRKELLSIISQIL